MCLENLAMTDIIDRSSCGLALMFLKVEGFGLYIGE